MKESNVSFLYAWTHAGKVKGLFTQHVLFFQGNFLFIDNYFAITQISEALVATERV